MTGLEGAIALVTGATKGIGLAVAGELAAAGATVLMNYRHDAEAAKAALHRVRGLGAAELVQADIADSGDIDRMFRRIRAEYGQLDALVSNAGVTRDGYAAMMSEAKWRSVLDTNLTGAFLCCRAAGRMMAGRRRGAIVAIGSTSGIAAPAGQVNYAASKAGLIAMVRVLAKELGGYGVRVNAVVPGFVDTAMTRAMPADQLDGHISRMPLRRIGRPEDIAPSVRFLLSGQDAGYITGTTVVVDGGMTC